ncbi:MAG: D-3-phosphoglycerate dehydrogenase [Candidatus Binatia bacterium]|nr:MAG: D-3-phosphoglycerate dehydrogenase [Candidatus Binatia bacterium]
MFRVLVADKLAKPGLDILRACPEIELEQSASLKPSELRAKIKPFHALIVRSGTTVTAEVIEAAENLKVIGRAGIGVDNIDVEAATKKGIVVMNTPAGNNVTTAEHTISMMLALARLIPQATASMKAGKWEKSKFIGAEVFNKTLGIIGMGNIGSLVAERALGLKMRVIAYDPFISREVAQRLGVELTSFEDVLERADFLTIHTPLTNETRGLIGAAAFARMKPGVRLVNCARGGIVDEQALHDAIVSGKVAGAALDVFAQEPPPPDHPLLKLEQVICTPHLGAATEEAQINVAVAIAQQVVNYLTRGVIQDAVNVPSMSPELLQVLSPYLTLAEKLGSLQGQMLTQAPTELAIEYAGEIAEYDVKALTLAVLRGLLNRVLESSVVNYVNAATIARERGIRVVEAKTPQPKGFSNLITVTATTESSVNVVAGAVFGQKVVRLVRINNFFLDADPEGYILMLHNRDVPGVVGAVGTLLGEAKINIARLELGREHVGGLAVSLVHVDDPVPPAVLEKLRQLPNIISAHLIKL